MLQNDNAKQKTDIEEKKDIDNTKNKFNSCSLMELYNFVQQSYHFIEESIAIFDIRSEKQFNLSHIQGAKNIDNIKKFGKFNENIKYPIVIYGHSKQDSINKLSQITISINQKSQIFIYNDDFNDF